MLVVTVVVVIAAAAAAFRPRRRRGRRQYVASKHARCYERRVSAVPALISGKPPQICPANSGSLSLIVVKKRGEPGGGEGEKKEKVPRLLLAPSLVDVFLQTIRDILYFLKRNNEIRQDFYFLPLLPSSTGMNFPNEPRQRRKILANDFKLYFVIV